MTLSPATDRGKFIAGLLVLILWSGFFFMLGCQVHKWLH